MAPQTHGTDEERRDEELQRVTVGALEPHDAPITLAAYDPGWPRSFDREADRLRSALGTVALRVEHVGPRPDGQARHRRAAGRTRLG